MVVMPLYTDIPIPFGVRAEVTADNTSIRVSWEWSCQGVPDFVRVHYRPEGRSLMMYTVSNTMAITSATLPNLQCNTKYTIWVYASVGQTGRTSAPGMVSLPARGMYMHVIPFFFAVIVNTIYYPSPSRSH